MAGAANVAARCSGVACVCGVRAMAASVVDGVLFCCGFVGVRAAFERLCVSVSRPYDDKPKSVNLMCPR